MPQLLCQNLSLGYEGKQVVSGLSFAVNAGEYLCIVGENGCGKSTLIRTILRLKAPLAGQIHLGEGLDATAIGYLPQQTVVQKDFPASVREVVRSGFAGRRGLRPLYAKAEKDQAESNIAKLGIASLAKQCYRELSGGQQQRVLLARALCATGKLLLLDEPTAGLDPKATVELYTLVASLNASGVSVIMISHDVAATLQYATHILHIGKGTQQFFGTVQAYQKSSLGQGYAHFPHKGGAPA